MATLLSSYPLFFSTLLPATEHFLAKLARQPAVLVQVAAAQGSVPREAGAWMAVFADSVVGTIGGGHLEHEAIARAQATLATSGKSSGPEKPAPVVVRWALGPSLGQCCGGVVQLNFERVSAGDLAELSQKLAVRRTPVALFGGGHVGQALARVLASLPFRLTWIDSREGIFPPDVPAQVACEHSEPVQAAVPGLASGSRVLVMSFSHAEDLEIVASCLLRQRRHADLPYIGLIGSQTKWAAFRHRLEARGFGARELAHITCPIGISGITGKAPEVIAVAVAAQLLQTMGGR